MYGLTFGSLSLNFITILMLFGIECNADKDSGYLHLLFTECISGLPGLYAINRY